MTFEMGFINNLKFKKTQYLKKLYLDLILKKMTHDGSTDTAE